MINLFQNAKRHCSMHEQTFSAIDTGNKTSSNINKPRTNNSTIWCISRTVA